jgi:hypothetical protein
VGVDTGETGAVQGGMERVVCDIRQWPGSRMSCQGTGHWPTVPEKQDIGGLQQDLMKGSHRVHGAVCLSAG